MANREYPTVFHLIATEFSKTQLPFALIGGFAVNYYKFSRTTADVDILMNEEDYPKALMILEMAGYKEMAFGDLFARLIHEKPTFFDLDILFVDRKTLIGILEDAKEMDIEGIKIKVPSLEHLMALKLHALKNNPHRENPDLIDLVNLISLHQIDVKSDSFRQLCLKFGTQELYEKLIREGTK